MKKEDKALLIFFIYLFINCMSLLIYGLVK